MASIWNWIHAQARAGTAEQQEIAHVFFAALDSYNTDNEQAKALLSDCRALADRYNEPWWGMLAEHWKLQIFLHNTSEIGAALDLSVWCAVETRKEKYRAFPQRVCLHEDLIYAYKFKDPIGYETEIRDAITYMEKEAADDSECRGCIKGLLYGLEEELGNYREAFDLAMEAAGFADGRHDGHHFSATLLDMCSILHRGMDTLTLEQYETIHGWAEGADEYYRFMEQQDSEKPSNRARVAMWQAFALRGLGKEAEAKRRFGAALSFAAKTDAVIGSDYTQAAIAYHELAGDTDKALAVAEHAAAQLAGKGVDWAEARWLWERCRLRDATGQLRESDLDEAMSRTARFKNPPYALHVLTNGDVSVGSDGYSDIAQSE